MSQDMIFVHSASLKEVRSKDERRRIRSNVIKASWRTKVSVSGRANPRRSRMGDTAISAGPARFRFSNEVQEPMFRIPFMEAPGSPRSLLSASKGDPFATHGLEIEDMYSQGILDYCVTELWPGFRPDQTYARNFARTWFARAASNKMVMSAILFSASVHQEMRMPADSLSSNSVSLQRHLRLKGEAIKSIRHRLSKGVALDQIDETIYSILCLAVNQRASLATRQPFDKSNFDSPFLGAQWLTMYGTMDFDPTHFAAIVALVQRKGGIDNVNAYSVGWLIFFAGLMGAANLLSTPVFPPVTVQGERYRYQNPLRLLSVLDMPYHFKLPSGGFHVFETMMICPSIIQTFLDVSEMSQAIQVYSNHDRHTGMLTEILDSRSELVYRLLCLPTSETEVIFRVEDSGSRGVESSTVAMMLYSCARLVSQLYSLHVMFPIARTGLIRKRLVPEIQEKLAWFESLVLEEVHQQLLLWCSMVTAVAASGGDSEVDVWFTSQCHRLSSDLDINTYADLQCLLRVFGWVDSACDRSGFSVWNKAKGNVS